MELHSTSTNENITKGRRVLELKLCFAIPCIIRGIFIVFVDFSTTYVYVVKNKTLIAFIFISLVLCRWRETVEAHTYE